MKDLKSIDHDFGGGDVKGSAKGKLAIDGSDLLAEVAVQARYPLEKAITPLNKVIDEIIDKVEKFIPGDQTDIAKGLKETAHKRLLELLTEKVAELPEPEAEA